MGVWHCEDCHKVGFYFNDEQRDAVIKEHEQQGHEKYVAEFHTTDKPPVTLPPHCGSVLRVVPKPEDQ